MWALQYFINYEKFSSYSIHDTRIVAIENVGNYNTSLCTGLAQKNMTTVTHFLEYTDHNPETHAYVHKTLTAVGLYFTNFYNFSNGKIKVEGSR